MDDINARLRLDEQEQSVMLRPLDEETARLLRRAMGNVPTIGLPGSGMTPASHVGAVIKTLLSLGDALGRSLREAESLREELRQRDADIAAVRRVLGTEK